MDWKDYIMIILVLGLLSFYFYTDKTKETIDQGITKVKDMTTHNTCTNITEPVCADNVTYQNSCYAEKKTKNWVIGECQK